jgi:hypothetical protein
MTVFLRLLSEPDKSHALAQVCASLRKQESDSRQFIVEPELFNAIPGKPFAYWVSNEIRQIFLRQKTLITSGGEAWMGLSSGSDIQWLRLFWEVIPSKIFDPRSTKGKPAQWVFLSKGGEYSKHYPRIHMVVDWTNDGAKLAKWKIAELEMGRITANNSKCWNITKYFRPGLTWSRRTNGLSFRIMPAGCIFGDKGPAAFVAGDNHNEILAMSGTLNSNAFGLLVSAQLARVELAQSYEVGLIQQTPVPPLNQQDKKTLSELVHRAWSLRYLLDAGNETAHAFLLPFPLLRRVKRYDPLAIESELVNVQAEINRITFDSYCFSDADRHAAIDKETVQFVADGDTDDNEERDHDQSVLALDAGLSWAIGVAFGRFDLRFATGEREVPPDPDPFDPLPAMSPGMLPDNAEPFHPHAGILVDDQGHPNDLARLVEEVLARVDVAVPDDVRRWLQRDFFAFHLPRYSKSRRKAPIYWPLATASGSYTLWLYYPSLSSQTLYTAINDFVEPKLKEVGAGGTALRNKGSARTRDEEKQFETLQAFELELIEMRDTLLGIAQGYQPNHHDGVQITAAPLWPLFRHKPWQKILKDTWAKLEKGDYDWAHLAMSYWPARVREKCETDKSLAIAHGLEDLYVEPEAKPKKTRAKKNAGAIE